MRTLWIRLLVAGFVLFPSGAAMSQTPTAQPAAPSAAQAPLKSEELDQLLAPIALYSDTLLAEVLMAATYPLEVVQAERWARTNKGLTGDKLKTALEQQGWDASVKSLIAVPAVLSMMSEKLDWTQKLGDAVLAQQKDVMDSIQRLRARAQAADKLRTTKEQKVTVKTEDGKQVIAVEQTSPETVYVPYYNPSVVYGDWPYPAYPPLYFPPPAGFVGGAALATGIAFGAGVAVGRAISWNYWRGGVGWGRNTIVNVDRANINNIRVSSWEHNPAHRHGVQYRSDSVRQKYGKAAVDSGNRHLDFRGHSGEQVLKPGSDRPGSGPAGIADRRSDAGDRPGADRPRNGAKGTPRAGISDRPAGGAKGTPKAGAGTPRVAHRDTAFSHPGGGTSARAHADRGRASATHQRAAAPRVAAPRGGGGGGFRGGGGRRR